MKKFYYSKETSQDESPIGYPMEHCNTMDVNNEQGLGMSARAASVNSLDLMSEAPTIPRVKTRDVTRSMSDVATKAQSQKHLVTETELSSSWLYKTMQASINARFKSPRKSPSAQKSELEQSILQDPELKPIPINSKAAKTSSCICHFATMIAISLCTVGFLASIAAIIYMEIFADNRNITSLHMHSTEAEVDLSDVALDSLEVHNLTANNDGEEHILNEARTHRFDGDEEILNEVLKASSTNDIPSLLNKNKSHEQFPDYVTDTGDLETTDFQQHIRTNSTIKFQDGVTIIYEMKSTESENEVDSGFSDGFKGRSFGIDFDQTDEDSSNDGFGKSPENTVKENAKQELGFYTESDRKISNDSIFSDNEEGIDTNTLNENSLKDYLKETVLEDEFKMKSVLENVKLDKWEKNESTEQVLKDVFLPSEKLNSTEIPESQNFEMENSPDLDTNDVLNSDGGNDLADKSEKYNGDNTQISEDSSTILTNLSDVQMVQLEDNFLPTLKGDDAVTDDYDVNTMLVTIDDTEVSTDSFISKRNGEINIFQVSSPVPSVEPVKQINNNFPIPPKKPVDIKGSLADAMKHLQKLDVNNKILTSRTKPKQKANVQTPKRKSVSNKDEERRRYLHRMRLMLFKQLQ